MEENKSMKNKGSKEEVYKGLAHCTAGGLKKDDIIYNEKSKKYVSKKRSELGKKQIKNLQKLGYGKKKESNDENNKNEDNDLNNEEESEEHSEDKGDNSLAPEPAPEPPANQLISPPVPIDLLPKEAVQEEKQEEKKQEEKKPKRAYNRKIKNENPHIDEIKNN